MVERVSAGKRFDGKARGFSLLELVVVIVIISILAVVLISRLSRIQAAAEAAAMESVAGTLRSAVGIKLAEYYVSGNERGIRSLAGSNPMNQLAQKPKNYLGELRKPNLSNLAKGNWYFDKDRRILIYLANNTEYFSGGKSNPQRARFVVRFVYNNNNKNSYRRSNSVAGVDLVSVEPYKWKR